MRASARGVAAFSTTGQLLARTHTTTTARRNHQRVCCCCCCCYSLCLFSHFIFPPHIRAHTRAREPNIKPNRRRHRQPSYANARASCSIIHFSPIHRGSSNGGGQCYVFNSESLHHSSVNVVSRQFTPLFLSLSVFVTSKRGRGAAAAATRPYTSRFTSSNDDDGGV